MALYQPPPGPRPGDTQLLPPAGPGAPGPWQPAPRPPLSALAVVGLVLALVLAPVGLVVSLVALGRTGAGRERGRGLAVAGTVIGGILTLLLLAGIAGSASGDGGRDVQGVGGTPASSSDTAPAVPATPAPDAPTDGGVPAPPPPATTAAPADTAPPAEAQAPAEPAAPPVPGLGVPVVDGEFTFTATRVERVGTEIENGIFRETAQGEFVVVHVTVVNTGDEARTLAAGWQKAFDPAGNEYAVTDAWLALPGADRSVWENINPGNTVADAPLLFDVPPGTALDRIELHDNWYSRGAAVDLP